MPGFCRISRNLPEIPGARFHWAPVINCHQFMNMVCPGRLGAPYILGLDWAIEFCTTRIRNVFLKSHVLLDSISRLRRPLYILENGFC